MKKSFIAKFLLSTMFIPTTLAGSCKANPQPNNTTVEPSIGRILKTPTVELDLTSYNDWDSTNVLSLKEVYDDYIASFEEHPDAIGILELSGVSLSRSKLFERIKNMLEKLKDTEKAPKYIRIHRFCEFSADANSARRDIKSMFPGADMFPPPESREEIERRFSDAIMSTKV